LIEKGADVNVKDRNGWSAFMFIGFYCNTTVTQLLIEKGADIEVKEPIFGSTPLMKTVEDRMTDSGRNACSDTTKLLISKGANINATDKNGWTTLMYATYNSENTSIAKLLLDNGVDINTKDNTGKTALMHAATSYRAGTVKFLIDNGADVNAKDNGGKTALQYAEEHGCTEIATILRQAGAKE
jgi:ankyrin repeat protein